LHGPLPTQTKHVIGKAWHTQRTAISDYNTFNKLSQQYR